MKSEPTKPPFIATQTLRRFAFSAEQREKARNYVRGDWLEADRISETDSSSTKSKLLQPVRRTEYLADLSYHRLCVTEDAGMGKSCVLQQLAYLRVRLCQHIVFHFDLVDLPALPSHFLDTNYQKATGDGTSDNVPPLLVDHAEKVFGACRDRFQLDLTSPDARAKLTAWIKTMIQRGVVTLIVDGVDQVGTKFGESRTKALDQFLQQFPKVHCVVAGRPYAIQEYWPQLFRRQQSADASDWEFCLLDSFSEAEVSSYLGKRRLDLINNLEADALAVPRSLSELRRMEFAKLSSARTSGDIYWHNVMQVIDTEIETHRRVGRIKLEPAEIIDLLSLLAFHMVQQFEGPILQMKLDRIRREKLRKRCGHLFDCDRDEFQQMLKELLSINSTYADGTFFNNMQDANEIRWRNPTLRDFFAALWLVRSSTEEDRAWMAERCSIRERFGTLQNANLYEVWRQLTGMPDTAFADRDDGNAIAWRYVASVQPLFNRPVDTGRPSEMIYRCWPRLLILSGWLGREWSEEDFHQATEDAQDAARESLTHQADFRRSTNKDLARSVVVGWLHEYPEILRGNVSPEATRVANRFEQEMKRIPPGDEPLEFWYGDDKERQAIDREFWLSSVQTTNELMRLCDHNHSSKNKNYNIYSPDPHRGAAIHVSWFEAWCLSTWLHGRLPKDREWEYACRARPGVTDDVPQFVWHFGNERESMIKFGWTREAKEPFAHTVGIKEPNGWGLFDMHGNVWEWCSDWGGPGHTSRVLRGGSFDYVAFNVRCSKRSRNDPAIASINVGCRVARAKSPFFP